MNVSLAAGESNKPTQAPTNEKSKLTPTPIEVKPTQVTKPTESKSAESKLDIEAKNTKEHKPDVKTGRESNAKPNPNSNSNSNKKEGENVGVYKRSNAVAGYFVRVEKSAGNKAILVVSGPKVGSIIKITITSKGSTK